MLNEQEILLIKRIRQLSEGGYKISLKDEVDYVLEFDWEKLAFEWMESLSTIYEVTNILLKEHQNDSN